MKKRHLFDYGLPFSKGLPETLDKLQARVNNNKASMIIVDGGIGEGKTTFSIHIADYINKLNGVPPIDLKKDPCPQLALGGEDFLQKLRMCYEQKLPCISYDEAGDFNKRGSLTKFNAMLNRTFETFRAFKCIVILTLPHFEVLDQSLFDKNIPRLLLHLRGRKRSYGNYYGFSLYRMQWLKFWMGRCKLKNQAFSKCTPNLYGHFLDLPPDRSKQLDKISTKNKMEILKSAETKIAGLVTFQEIAKKIWRSVNWTREAIKELNLKPKRIIKKVYYFEGETIDILANHIENKVDLRTK